MIQSTWVFQGVDQVPARGGGERAKGGGIKRRLVELMKRSDQEGPRGQES